MKIFSPIFTKKHYILGSKLVDKKLVDKNNWLFGSISE